jgi:hypothetical protein
MSEVLSSWFGQETGYSMSVISIRCGLTLLHFFGREPSLGCWRLRPRSCFGTTRPRFTTGCTPQSVLFAERTTTMV